MCFHHELHGDPAYLHSSSDLKKLRNSEKTNAMQIFTL